MSIRSKLSPFHSHSSARRSRVTPGLRVGDRLAAARQPIDQRALPRVREADHRHRRATPQRAGQWLVPPPSIRRSPARGRASAIRSTTSIRASGPSCRSRSTHRRDAAGCPPAPGRACRGPCIALLNLIDRLPGVGRPPASSLRLVRRQEDLERASRGSPPSRCPGPRPRSCRRRSARAGASPSPVGPADAPRRCEAAIVTSGERIRPSTGLPSRRIVSPSKSMSRSQAISPSRSPSSGSIPRSSAASADGAVHRPGVEVGEAERPGDALRHG